MLKLSSCKEWKDYIETSKKLDEINIKVSQNVIRKLNYTLFVGFTNFIPNGYPNTTIVEPSGKVALLLLKRIHGVVKVIINENVSDISILCFNEAVKKMEKEISVEVLPELCLNKELDKLIKRS